MNFLKSLFKKSQPLTMEHPDLGHLLFQDVGFWEGKMFFPPLQTEIEILLDGDKEGPSCSYREFLPRLITRYIDLENQFERMINEEFSVMNSKSLEGKTWEEFYLEGLDVPTTDSDDFEWDITFAPRTTDHYYTIHMKDWTPVKVVIDG